MRCLLRMQHGQCPKRGSEDVSQDTGKLCGVKAPLASVGLENTRGTSIRDYIVGHVTFW